MVLDTLLRLYFHAQPPNQPTKTGVVIPHMKMSEAHRDLHQG